MQKLQKRILTILAVAFICAIVYALWSYNAHKQMEKELHRDEIELPDKKVLW